MFKNNFDLVWHVRSLDVIIPILIIRKKPNKLKIVNSFKSFRQLRSQGKPLPPNWRDRQGDTESR